MRRVTQQTEREIVNRYESGSTTHAIVDDTGLSYGCVHKTLVRNGVKLRPKGTGRPTKRKVSEDGWKVCSGCEQRLPSENFHFNRARPDGLNDTCRKCWAAYQSERTLMRKFGITLITFKRMLTAQDGGCAICGSKIGMVRAGKELRLAVDHCHLTGTVRGLLCSNCNNGIGRFQDDPTLLIKAAKYLQGG